MRTSITATVVVLTTVACTLCAADPPGETSSESENQSLLPVVEHAESDRDSPHVTVSIRTAPLRDRAVARRSNAATVRCILIARRQKHELD